MSLFCAAKCALPRRHAETCTDTQCAGCRPAQALDGALLCGHHRDRIGIDATRAAQLDIDLALALLPTGDGAGGRGDHGGISLSDAAVAARTDLRVKLAEWCKLIADERGIQLPGFRRIKRLPPGVEGPLPAPRWILNDSPDGMAHYIATHTSWLAAHPLAAFASEEMADLARKAYAAAYPSGTRIIHIGRCPAVDDDQLPCPGSIRALLRTEASLLPSAVACDVADTHTWGADQWRALGRQMAPAR